jgi:hypothetical protein
MQFDSEKTVGGIAYLMESEGGERELPMIRSALPRVGAIEGLGGLGSRLVVLALALSCAACGGSPAVLTAFRTEQQAQEHCPSDTVVWLDPQSGAYYLKRSPSYGQAGAGRYACRGEAKDAGMHEMAN